MGIFFVYILKSSVCLVVFYLFYRLLLSRETFHRFNRVALLSILLLSCLLPLVEVTVEEQTYLNDTNDHCSQKVQCTENNIQNIHNGLLLWVSCVTICTVPVSYTHLDVYKRQVQDRDHSAGRQGLPLLERENGPLGDRGRQLPAAGGCQRTGHPPARRGARAGHWCPGPLCWQGCAVLPHR